MCVYVCERAKMKGEEVGDSIDLKEWAWRQVHTMLKQQQFLRQRQYVYGRTGPSCANMQCINRGTRRFKFELLRSGQDGPGVIGSAGALAACGVQIHRQVLL